MKTRNSQAALTLAAALAVLLFAGAVLAIYRMRPTPGTVILILGWMSILAAGYFLVRSVGSLGADAGFLEEISGGRRQELEREKKLLLKAIKEVEFDRDTGKLDGTEAKAVIGRYRGKAIEIMRLLDDEATTAYESQIEQELERRLAAGEQGGPPACATCRAVNDEDAAFCKKCGAKLEARA